MVRSSQDRIERQLSELVALLRDHPSGLRRPAIENLYSQRSDESLTPRTLLRRLNRLAEQERIVVEGAGVATTYRVADHEGTLAAEEAIRPDEVEREDRAGEDEDGQIALSTSGAEVRKLILRPITQRTPVGYDRSFLEDYVPGQTWYLPQALRRRLHERGHTPDPERPAGTYAREIYENLLIDLSWASSRLEGNTYSRLDTASLLKFGQVAEGKDAREAQMVLNHKRAIDFLVEEAEELAFNRRTLLTLHALLSENLVGDPADEGRLRRRIVQITGTTYTPVAIPQVIEDCFAQFLERADAIDDPFEQAFFSMVHLPYLQPFVDVNKRTSRLAANIPLIHKNLSPLSFIDVPRQLYLQATLAIYELRRVDLLRDLFEWAYERSCAQYRIVRDALVEPDPLRLKYGDEIKASVRHVVLSQLSPTRALLIQWATENDIPADDREPFAERALHILLSLSEGMAGRYRISQDALEKWRELQLPSNH